MENEIRPPSQPEGFQAQDFRLFLAQQTLSENLNIPMRILRHDAFERLESVVPPTIYSEIRSLRDQDFEGGDPFEEEIPPHIERALSPSREKNWEKFVQVSEVFWITPRSAPNPLYDEIKNSLPRLQALLRLNILRVLRRLRSASEPVDAHELLDLPAGLVGLFQFLHTPCGGESHPAVLVIGPSRRLPEVSVTKKGEDGGGDISPNRYVGHEKQLRRVMAQIDGLKPGQPLSIEDKTNLLVLSTAYFINSDRDLHFKAATAKAVLRRAMELEAAHPDIVGTLSTSEWSRAIQLIFFWQSKRTYPVLEHAIRSAQPGRFGQIFQSSVYFTVEQCLSSSDAEPECRRAIRLTGEIVHGDLTSPEQWKVSFCEPRQVRAPDEFDIWLDQDPQLSDEEKESLTYMFRRSVEDSLSNRAWQEYLFFDRLRHTLQHKEFDDVTSREQLLTRRAQRLVMGDVAAYFDFESLKDQLRTASVHRAQWVQRNDLPALDQWLKEVAGNLQDRRQSMIYRCADSQCFQGRFEVEEDSRPFATQFVDNPRHLSVDRKVWGLEPNDLMAVPVQFHDRLLGVLYLVAGTPNRFRYYDRIRLLSFVRMFEVELFEAKLLGALREMNEKLGEALRRSGAQGDFCDELMRKLGDLLAASAAVLWWRSPVEANRFQVLGYAGSKIENVIKHEAEVKEGDLPLKDIWDESRNIRLTTYGVYGQHLKSIKNLPWAHFTCILLPDLSGQRVQGVITLHCPSRFTVSPFLADELRFIRSELRQNLIQYMEHQERVRSVEDVVGHEIQSALKHIDNIRRRLQPFRGDLSPEIVRDFDLRLEDLDRNVQRARLLSDWLTMDSIQWKGLHKEEAGIFSHYRLLVQHLTAPLAVHDVLLAALHGRAADLKKKAISWVVAGSRLPPFWIDHGALEQVLNNLVDNLVKYGARNHNAIVGYERDSLEYFLKLTTRGQPLREDLRATPSVIFKPRQRGVSDEIAATVEGSGQGLYTARELARQWGGELSVEYEHGHPWATYTFVVSFPRWLQSEHNPWPLRKESA